MRFTALLLLSCALLAGACHKELSPEEQLEADKQAIRDYLSAHSIQADSTASGMYYLITQPGSGGHPSLSAEVEVRYTGFLLDGYIFDQTPGSTTRTFPLGQLITGWQEGIPLLQRGGKGTFFLPSALGYGSGAVGDIPANSVLIFEIELVDF